MIRVKLGKLQCVILPMKDAVSFLDVIIAPSGEVIAGPLWDKEEILYADLDLCEITKAKIDFDVVGHYARPDIF